MNTYRALTPAAVAAFADGVFEADFAPNAEKDHIDAGLIEIVPRAYRVLSNNFAAGDQGSEIEAAYPVEIEQALIQGGHIERVDQEVDEELSDDDESDEDIEDEKED